MSQKKYVSLSKLQTFLENLKGTFASKTHTHKVSDLTDYKVDSTLSSTSTNPVQNKVIDAELEAIATAMNALDAAIDDKADSDHSHDDRYYTETEIDTKLASKADSSHSHSEYVPTSRTVNGKALSSNISLSASDVGALPNTTSIPDALSDLASDSTHRTVTDAEKTAWNAKSNFSGNYNDLTNKPTIPSISGLATETYVNDIADTKVDKVTGKGLSTNDYTTTEKNKLSGIASGAEVNQNAFSNVVVGTTTIAADSKTDSLTIAAGTGISVAGDATNDKVTITNSGVRSISTGSSNGTISVNTNGASADVAVKGLGSAAYTASTAYDAAGSADDALALAKEYTNTKVSGLASTTVVDNKISTHNTSTTAHNDIRELISGLTTRLNTLANSDDTTLDQLSEIVTYIKNNKSLIDGITTSKVNVSDIINNLTTNVTNKPLSAAQGVAIKSLIDTLQSSLNTHDTNTTKHITSTERTNWNAAKTHADSAHAPSNAQPNQNAFSNIAVSGQTTVAADTATDTVTFVGSNVSITTDATNDKVTFSVANGTTTAKGVVQLTDSISSTSTTTAATPKNVKAAYDLANTAKTTADGKANASHTHTVANITDLTATATELNYMDGVTSNVQAQIDANKEAISNIVEDEVTTEIVEMSDTAYWWATAYGNGRFVATVSYGYDDAAYSDDGVNWVNTTMPSIGEWDCVTFGNGKFVSLNAETSNQGAYSTDGITWVPMTMPVSAVWTDVTYGNGMFVAIASGTNAFATSKDGIHWTSGTMPSNNTWKSIAYDNGTFVAVTSGTNSTVAAYGIVQNDTVVWNETTIPAANWHTVRGGNGKFVAISVTSGESDSNSSISAYSTDGINWIATGMPEAAKWRALAYGAGVFIAAPSNTVKTLAYTRDGINWNIVKFSSSGWWNSAAYGDGKFFLTSGFGNSSQAGIAIFKNKAGFAYRDEVTLESLNVYSKEDHEWTLIHDSGRIASKVNTISGIDISGYKHLMVAVSCVNDGSNISKSGSVIFTASSGKTYQFPCWTNLFSTSTDVSSAGMAWFDVINGYLVCPYASRNIRASKFLSSTEGGTADNLTSTGGGIMKCTKPLTTLAVSSLDQDTSCFFGIGSRVMVWGCNA